MTSFLHKKLVPSILILAIFVTQYLQIPIAYAASFSPAEPDNSIETQFDLVTLVVDSALDTDNSSYLGLKAEGHSGLDELQIGERVLRYADDIRNNYDLTDVKIIFYDRDKDTVPELVGSLENLYRNGAGGKNNKLTGVVLIGDIPLPVVNKSGNRYVSVFPYTDFSNKAFVYNEVTETFDFNSLIGYPKPEIWHGVMRPPSNDNAGIEKLAAFFDKNHLYYEGDPEFAEFEKKVFFGDLVAEERQIHDDVYKRYVEYIDSMEDLAYMRFNKFWAEELVGNVAAESIPTEYAEYTGDNPAFMNQKPEGRDAFVANLTSGRVFENMPDIHTRGVINQFLIPYYRVLNRYVSSLNDWAEYTGRYRPVADVDSVPALIGMKDDYTRLYLRNVNDALETAVNQVARDIEEPLPLLDYSSLSGTFGEDAFEYALVTDYDPNTADAIADATADVLDGIPGAAELLAFLTPDKVNNIFFRYHYYNEEVEKLFVNGIDSDVIESAKVCSPYLGSTKASYFNENLDFDPKAVDGDYSILARALRSDSLSTIGPVYTSGVNTRLLTPEELRDATGGFYPGDFGDDGVFQTGAIVEANPEYGVSIFLQNPLYEHGDDDPEDEDYNYIGPFERVLREDDVIVAVNGRSLTHQYDFNTAISESYNAVADVIKAFNKRDLSRLVFFEHTLILEGSDGDLDYDVFETPSEIMNSRRFLDEIADLDPIYYTGNPEDDATVEANAEKIFGKDTGDDDILGLISVDYIRGGRRYTEDFTFTVTVEDDELTTTRMSADGGELDNLAVIMSSNWVEGDRFDFGEDSQGAIFTLYGSAEEGGYYESPYDNSAGCNGGATLRNGDKCLAKVATMPVLDPGGALALEKVAVPGLPIDVLEFPEKIFKDDASANSQDPVLNSIHVDQFQIPDTYEYDDIDELYMDSCYAGMPAAPYGPGGDDSNPYRFVLDSDTEDGDDEMYIDFYGRLMKSFGDYVDSDEAEWADYLDPDEGEDLVKDWTDGESYLYEIDLLEYNPRDTIWANLDKFHAGEIFLSDSPQVSLQHFSDRYGLWDGIDNDGDGIVDYEWRDNDDDGFYETKWWDFGEADPQYGIPKENIAEIGRKMLSHTSKYRLPGGITGDSFSTTIELQVNPHVYKSRYISSVILHNEPTPYTISKQLESQAAFTMPIDNPRYVAFQSKSVTKPANPNPPEPEEGEPALDVTPHYSPGAINKISYVNLYDIPNMAQMQSDLRQKAQEFAIIPGAYRVFGSSASADDYTTLDISEKIYNDYFMPVVMNAADSPLDGFTLDAAATDKIYDALLWANYNIDEKHEYVLEFYLSADERHDAYINDPVRGYEAAYLVFDGSEDRFEINFNKDVEEEGDIRFDSLAAFRSDAPERVEEIPDSDGDGRSDFVTLPEFLQELVEFGEGIANIATSVVEFGGDGDDEPEYPKDESGPNSFDLFANGELIAGESEELELEARLGKKGGLVSYSIVSGGEFVSFSGGSAKQAVDGVAKAYLKPGEKAGRVQIKADAPGFDPITKTVFVLANEPVKIDIEASTKMLVANEQSKAQLRFVLKDAYGNVANNTFANLSVFIDEGLEAARGVDTNSDLPGVQMSTFEGFADLEVAAQNLTGNAKVVAVLMDYNLENLMLATDDIRDINFGDYVGRSLSFTLVDDMDLEFSVLDVDFAETGEILADAGSRARIGVTLLHDGRVVNSYNGPVEFKVLNENLGSFVNEIPEAMTDGVLAAANVNFDSTYVAGNVNILVDVPGFVSDTVSFDSLPLAPVSLELISDKDSLEVDGEGIRIEARLIDEHGNLVDTDRGRPIRFYATDATSGLVSLAPASALTMDGVAATLAQGRNLSGTVNLIAEADGMEPATLTLKASREIQVHNIEPRVLYMSVYGGDYGNINGGIAQSFLYSGQTQAISSLSAKSVGNLRMFGVDAYGRSEVLENNVRTEIVAANDSFPYQKIVFADTISDDELGEVFMVPDPEATLKLNEDGEDGIFVDTFEDVVSELKNGNIIIDGEVRIDRFGRIFLTDGYELGFPRDPVADLAFVITNGSKEIATVSYRQDFEADVKVVDELPSAFFPGVYLVLNTSSEKYGLVEALSRASSDEPKGVYMVDLESEIDILQAPGFGHDSVDDAEELFGLGFEGDNKHMLFFAAGNSVGESHIPYASDIGIIYGDPMVRVDASEDQTDSGYNESIGKPIYTGDKDIKEIMNFDFNGDGYDDLLLAYDDGFVGLLENTRSNARYQDRGNVLYLANGVHSLTKIDVNNDSYDDLVVGTKESCFEDEQCVSLFMNDGGNFVREALNLNLNDRKIFEMKSADMNADGCEDLIASDSGGYISIFYNDGCESIDTNYGLRKSYGFEVNQDVNLINNLFVGYDGISIDADDVVVDFGSSKFKHIGDEARFSTSTKQSVDLNGDTASIGDEIEYTIVLKNGASGNIGNLMVSDKTSPSMSYVEGSLDCSNCSNTIQKDDSGLRSRAWIISNIDVPSNQSRTIKYRMKVEALPSVHFDVGEDFIEYPSDNSDGYPDILVKPEFNKEGILTYLYSTGLNSDGSVNYTELEVETTGIDRAEEQAKQAAAAGQPSPSEMAAHRISAQNSLESGSTTDNNLSPALERQLKVSAAAANADSDYNGCPDAWSPTVRNLGDAINVAGEAIGAALDAASAVADGVAGALASLRCSGGCLPIPFNYAYLVPDNALPGVAIIAAGIPSIPPVLPMQSSYVPSTFRLYLSFTNTLALGTAVCAGPSAGFTGVHTAPCFAFAVPNPATAACGDLISGALDAAVSFAKESIIDPALGQATIISDGDDTATSDDTEFSASAGDADDPFSASVQINIRVPGFPAVITEWIDKQMDEIYTKLLSFPTFYLILPDFSSLGISNDQSDAISDAADILGDEVSWQNFSDFATNLSKIPIIQIDTKEVLIRVPAISAAEIQKYKIQGERWIEHMESEIQRFKDLHCDLEDIDNKNARSNICDKLLLDISDLITSVKNFLSLLDTIADLPKDILSWRYIEARYASQIVAYLDTIMFVMGGYIVKQQKIIESWMDAIENVIKIFESWKALLDLAIEYQASCDQCKNDRFSKLGLLMQLFVAIPEPPIIPLPKWPNFVIDLSQIKTGIHILWPDVVFKPEPFILPNLPIVNLPDILPEIEIEIPGFDVPVIPELILPTLPDLPPLSIPDLPDLPRPPTIPSIPDLVADLALALKPIFKILCLLKNGLLPVPEASLETEIETMTQPSVTILIPLLKALAIEVPPIQYDYVKEIRFNVKLAFEVDATFIYDTVKFAADTWNGAVKELVTVVNTLVGLPFQYVENLSALIEDAVEKAAAAAVEAATTAVEGAVDAAVEAVESGVDAAIDATGDAIDSALESSLPLAYEREDLQNELEFFGVEGHLDEFNTLLEDFIAEMEDSYPEDYTLIATEHILDPEGAILNRSLAEIEAGMAIAADLPNVPHIRKIAGLRDGLLAYAKGLEKSNSLLENINDYGEFTRILVDSDESLKRFASVSVPRSSSSSPNTNLEFSLFGDGIEQRLTHEARVSKEERRLFADLQEDLGPDIPKALPSGPPKGFWVAGDFGVLEVKYNAELGGTVNVIYSDMDQDSDPDMIYSLGSDLYVKENYKESIDLPRGDLILSFSENSVGDYVGTPAVQDAIAPFTGSKTVDLNWTPVGGAEGYEVWLRKSLSEDIADAFDKISVTDPSATIELENGNYYANVFAVVGGELSLASDDLVVAPQQCADREAPLPVSNSDYFSVPVLKELEVDASNSFDAAGEVVSYELDGPEGSTLWSDINLSIDSDGDGNATNDKSNPRFRVGPFKDVGIQNYVLRVKDEAGNSAEHEISVEVFVPAIGLDETFGRTGVATGATEPSVEEMPFSLMRNRFIYRVVDGDLSIAPRTDRVANGITDAKGQYEIDEFDLENMILVENAAGEVVAEIHPETGNIGKLASGYYADVHEATVPTTATNITIMGPGGLLLGTVYLVADPNFDVIVDGEQAGVNVTNFDGDEYDFVSLPANDVSHPGGAVLYDEDRMESLLIVDSAGNILLLNEDVRLRHKTNDHESEPLLIEVVIGPDVVGEIFVNPFNGAVQIVGPNDVPFAPPRSPSAASLYGSYPFDFSEEVSQFAFNDDELVTREDFVRMVLAMLCILPRDEAYEAGIGYNDVGFDGGSEAYAYIKEATLLGLIEGYTGELDSDGLMPFKPEAPISRAEAVKIILEAMELQETLDLSGLTVKEGEAWYVPFMSYAQDIQGQYFVTADEASKPNEELTYGELFAMAERVIGISDCSEIDEDKDGMSDYCEALHDIDDPVLDPDNDGLPNIDECFYGLDPNDPDSDDGGSLDGAEIWFKTNPLDPDDDPEDDDGDGLSNLAETLIHDTDPSLSDSDGGGTSDGDEVLYRTDPLDPEDDDDRNATGPTEDGIYIVPSDCNTCPCAATFVNAADVVVGDVFFPVIADFADVIRVYAKGNEVSVISLP